MSFLHKEVREKTANEISVFSPIFSANYSYSFFNYIGKISNKKGNFLSWYFYLGEIVQRTSMEEGSNLKKKTHV